MSNKLVLRVNKVDNCPLFMTGERMVLAPPEVLKLNSDRICALALAKLFSFSLEMMSRVDEPGYKPVEASCPGCQGGKAFFQVEAFTAPRQPGVTMRLERAAETRQQKQDQSGRGPFLSRLSPRVVKELLASCKVRKYHEPTVLVREGEEGRFFHIVGKGEVEVLKSDRTTGEETLLVILGKGECFGEMSLLTGDPISATVRTRGEGTAVLTCDKDTLLDLKRRLPELYDHFNSLLIQRLRATTEQYETEVGRGMRGRLAMMPLGDVIQTLNSARRTGTLLVECTRGEGVLLFQSGNVVGSGLGETRGEEAIYTMLTWKEGDFKFRDEKSIEPDGTISQSVASLLMEGMRRIDELQRKGA